MIDDDEQFWRAYLNHHHLKLGDVPELLAAAKALGEARGAAIPERIWAVLPEAQVTLMPDAVVDAEKILELAQFFARENVGGARGSDASGEFEVAGGKSRAR